MANDRQPRWKKWRLMPEVDIWQAVALSLNIEPEKVQTSDHAWMGARFPFNEGDEFDDRLNITLAYASNRAHFPTPCRLNMGGGYLCGIRLSEFAEWAVSVAEWKNLPPELTAMAIKPDVSPAKAQSAQINHDSVPSSNDWRDKARAIADSLFDRDTANKCRDSLAGYSRRVMDEMQMKEIHGPRGRIDNHNTIQREALQGDKWWAKKPK